MWLGETAHYAAQTVHSKHFLYVLFWSNIISFWYTDFTKIILRLNPIRHETLCHSPFLEPRGLCFTCGFQCSAFERWQLTGRKWEVSAEGQTKQSKGCFSERAEGKHSKGKGCGRVKHSSRCTDGLRIFIKLTRHHVRRALPEKKKKKKSVPRWTVSSIAVSLLIMQQCRSTSELHSVVCVGSHAFAQGESDGGHVEGTVLSATSVVHNRYIKRWYALFFFF